MAKKPTALDTIMAERINLGGEIVTRKEAYATLIAEGNSKECADFFSFSTPKVAEPTPGLYEKLRKGVIIHVETLSSGNRFSIQPEQWEGITMGYSVLVDGQVVPGYKGKMLDCETVKDWCNQLREIEE
jgi:hypothetical protein